MLQGSDPKYTTTNSVKFRGQDKPMGSSLGHNPNSAPGDEDYVAVL